MGAFLGLRVVFVLFDPHTEPHGERTLITEDNLAKVMLTLCFGWQYPNCQLALFRVGLRLSVHPTRLRDTDTLSEMFFESI
jgi:hypothetical protein